MTPFPSYGLFFTAAVVLYAAFYLVPLWSRGRALHVGALDTLRFETTANGVPNIPEFGSVKSEAGFRGLLAMSTYANIKPGTAYPAVMLTHGTNDPRVEVWNSTKAAARLQAATTSGKPVLLRLDYESGHGVGSTKSQTLDERADVFAFMLWQMGVGAFQPATSSARP